MAAAKGNKYALGLTTSGRPAKYKDSNELQKRILKYFDHLTESKQRPTITGLVLYLGFSQKSTLYKYGRKKEFRHCIRRALTFVEQEYELALLEKGATGAIFALKQFGWTDKEPEIEREYKVSFEEKIIPIEGKS